MNQFLFLPPTASKMKLTSKVVKNGLKITIIILLSPRLSLNPRKTLYTLLSFVNWSSLKEKMFGGYELLGFSSIKLEWILLQLSCFEETPKIIGNYFRMRSDKPWDFQRVQGWRCFWLKSMQLSHPQDNCNPTIKLLFKVFKGQEKIEKHFSNQVPDR